MKIRSVDPGAPRGTPRRILHDRDLFANVVLFLMMMSLLADMALPGTRHTSEISSNDRTLCHLIQISILGAMSVFVCCNYRLPRIPAVMFWEVSLVVFLALSLCNAAFVSGRDQVVTLTKFTYWPIGYFFFRTLADEVRGYTWKLTCLLLVLFVFAAWYYVSQAELRSEIAAMAGSASSNVGWNLLSIFAVSLCLAAAGGRRGYVVGAFALLLVPMSLKRGAILAEAVLGASLLMAGQRLGLLKEFLRRNAPWIIGVVVIWFCVCMSQLEWVLKRFSGLAEDGGSGRSQFYPLLVQRWWRADLFHWLFGFGFWSAPEFIGRAWLGEMYAHSDVLEMLHDYGTAGILSYLMILGGLFSLCRHTWRFREEGLLIAASIFSIFFISGMISGQIMFRETVYLMMPLGCMAGKLEKAQAA